MTQLRKITAPVYTAALFFIAVAAAPALHLARSVQAPTVVTVPFRLQRNLICLKVAVNDQQPEWFVLDTGAGITVLDTEFAKKSGIALTGSINASGGGEAVARGQFASGAKYRVGDAQAVELPAMALSIAGLGKPLGVAIKGILGYDYFMRNVVEVDYAKSEIKLHPPSTYRPRSGMKEWPIDISGRIPLAKATLTFEQGKEPVEGQFLVDSGSADALNLFSPFVGWHNLTSLAHPTHVRKAMGVGGETDERIARLDRLSVVGFDLPKPVAALSQAKSGVLATAGRAGLIGGQILQRFHVVIDYPGKRMLLGKSDMFGDPFEEDMSGLGLSANGDNLESIIVRYVQEQSPAAEAGVRTGDELIEVNGKAAKGDSMESVRKDLRVANKKVKLLLKRGTEKVELTLTTRRLI
jgi:hypothetical protein